MTMHPRLLLTLLAATCLMACTSTENALAIDGHRNRMPQGGGVIYPAWTGEYWSNPTMQGEPDYTRSDIRIRFDWEDWRPTLGVRAESVRNFPTDRFSARWTGQIIARFDENYTFKMVSDERARLKIKPADQGKWTTLIDAWSPHKRRADTGTIALKPGVRYDVVVEYADLTGDAVCELHWSSPSTPEEVLDYVSGNSVHFVIPQNMANLFSFSGTGRMGSPRPANSATMQGTKVDENGWPTEDFSAALLQGYSHYAGRGQIVFTGQAEVGVGGATLEVDGKRYDRLPKGVGYDSKTNRTQAFVIWAKTDDGTTHSNISMRQTQRTPSSPVGSGVTDLEVLLPTQVNGDTPHEPGEIIHQETRDAYKSIFTFRVQRTGLNDIVKWEERTRPTYSKIIGQTWRADMAYEKLILAANETGRDLHLNFSGSCDEHFMRKLAQLMKYGSDGDEPYTQPTPNPVWPPLNPNLRLYLEHGNEMGWSAIQPRAWTNVDYQRIRKDKGPIWDALNFDGKIESDFHFGVMRYHAYRTARMSENMRAVWGDEAMGETIRVCLFGQYERWFQNGMMQYLNDYFGNPEHYPTPRKPSELLWGAGPAVYYGSTNNFMVSDKVYLTNRNFEQAEVGKGKAVLRPSVPGWEFQGNAGIVDIRNPRYEAIASSKAIGEQAIKGNAVVGFQFTVGDEDLFVYQVGRTAVKGDKGRAGTMIVTLDGKSLANNKQPDAELGRMKPGQTHYSQLEYCGWATTDSSRIGVWRLEAGKTYAVVTEASNVTLPGPGSKLDPGPGLEIDGAVIAEGATVSQRGVSGGALKKISDAGQGFTIATFRYAAATPVNSQIAVSPADPYLDPTWKDGGRGKSYIPPSHRSGTKAAFLAGGGKMSTTFELAEDGEYALVFTANETNVDRGSRDGKNPFTVKIDGKTIWNTSTGGGRKPNGGVFQWGTEYTPLKAGKHELVIETTKDDPKQVTYFYSMHLGNLSDYYGGPTATNFLGAGAATGQTEGRFALVTQLTTAEAQLWGLVPYAYEGGTNAGGDWNGGKLYYPNQFKWNHPISKVADNQWANFWHNYGGANAFYYYPGYEYKYTFRAETFMPWAASIDRAHTWVLEPKGPTAAPVTFAPDQKHFQGEPASRWDGWAHPWSSDRAYDSTIDGGNLIPGQWKGFVFRAAKAGKHTITAQTTGTGKVKLYVNDTQGVIEGPAGGKLRLAVDLTQSVHAVRLECVEGKIEVKSIRVE